MIVEEPAQKIDKPHVEKRIRDWQKRIADLYSTINHWLENTGFSLKRGTKLIMYEELMWQFDVAKAEIDTMDIYKGKNFILTIKPNGLWVIGANGRIDILTTKGNYQLVDFADQFKTPQWKLFDGNKGDGELFTKQVFLQLLK